MIVILGVKTGQQIRIQKAGKRSAGLKDQCEILVGDRTINLEIDEVKELVLALKMYLDIYS